MENKLAAVRRYFNNAAKELNNAVGTFPSTCWPVSFGFYREEMFELDFSDRKNMEERPDISFK